MDRVLEAVKSGDEAVIKSAINTLRNINENTLNILLESSPSEKTSAFIKNLLIDKISTLEKENVSEEPSNKLHGNDTTQRLETKGEGFNLPSGMKVYMSHNNVSEEESIKKYATGNSKIDKAAQILVGAFKQNIIPINFNKASLLSYKIADCIYQKHMDDFPKIIRSKVHNLKENGKLCGKVYDEEVDPLQFVEMSTTDMMCDELRSKDAETIRDSLLSAQVAKATAETEIFQCSRCKERKCTYYQLQTRSCDEPMTTFVACVACGHKWRF